MKLKEFYDNAIAIGRENDPRGKEIVEKDLLARKREFDSLKEDEKEFFDREALSNPYSDSRILNGSGQEDIRNILVGIDIEVGEVLLSEKLGETGRGIDLLLAHHPGGRAYAGLYDVLHMQADILHRFGVPISTAEDLTDSRMREVERKLMPANHARAVDAARLLGMPFLCLHTPADNMVATYLQRTFDENEPYTVAEVLGILKGIPEYREASCNGAGPKVFLGSGARKAGRIFVDMTGGTEGSKEIFSSMAAGGVNTIVAMHLSEEHRKEAEKSHLNVVIAGHISSDNLGMNLLLDELAKSAGSPFTIYECSGFRRFSRTAASV